MAFITQWETAKSKFEEATKAKKPTKKFLGVFRKGTGIESALGAVDSAKTKKDILKAIEKFEDAADKYLVTLVKEASDPTSVPEKDKEAYIAAIHKMEKALKRIVTEATSLSESLEGKGDKEQVDAKLLQAAEEHLNMQRKFIDKVAKVTGEMAEHEKKLKMYLNGAKKSLAVYLDPRMASQASVNAITLRRFADEAEELRAKTCRPRKKEVDTAATAAQQQLADVNGVKGKVAQVPAKTVQEAAKNLKLIETVIKKLNEVYGKIAEMADELRDIGEEAKPVDREALEEAQAHIDLRLRMVKEVTTWTKEAAGEAQKMINYVKQAKLFHSQAATAQKQQNKTVLDKSEQQIQDVLQKSAKLVEDLLKKRDERVEGGSDLMKARGDNDPPFGKLPPRIAGPMRKSRGEAFDKLEPVQRKWQEVIAKIQSAHIGIGDIAEQVEGMNGKTKPPTEYIKRLQPLKDELDKQAKVLSTRVDKMQGMVRTTIPTHVKKAEEDAGTYIAALKKHYDLFVKANEATADAKKNARVMNERAKAIPSQEKGVQALVKEVEELAAAVDNLCADCEKEESLTAAAFKDAFLKMKSLQTV